MKSSASSKFSSGQSNLNQWIVISEEFLKIGLKLILADRKRKDLKSKVDPAVESKMNYSKISPNLNVSSDPTNKLNY
jgi:hypothetical protein